jgi:hypothetical protein
MSKQLQQTIAFLLRKREKLEAQIDLLRLRQRVLFGTASMPRRKNAVRVTVHTRR